VEKWPNLFMVGAPRTGTTSLYEYLNNIPEIYMSPNKEPHFFAFDAVPYLNPIRNKEMYLNLFEKVGDEKFLGEGSTHYLSYLDAPKLIHKVSPHAKIIIGLRDPVDRLVSHYLLRKHAERFRLLFHEQIQRELKFSNSTKEMFPIMKFSKYAEDVKRYLDIFGKNQVKIIIFEEFVKDPKKTVEDILRFLGLNQSLANFKDDVYNQYVGRAVPRGKLSQLILDKSAKSKIIKKIIPYSTRRFLENKTLTKKEPKPKIDQADRELLIDFYKDDVKKLENLLGQKMPWRNFKNS